MKDKIKARFPGVFGRLKRGYYRLRRLNPFISSRYMYIFRGKYLDLRHFKSVELKPNLILIGAAKSGTTSLHHYLNQHPDIFMSYPNKEPQYLMPFGIAKQYYEKSNIVVRNADDILKNHMLRGYKGEQIFGESTTTYTRARSADAYDIPSNLQEMAAGQVKLIYLLRHPIERIVSNYLHKIRDGKTDLSLEEDVSQTKSYLRTSMYADQLKKYLRFVPLEDVHVLFQDDLIRKPEMELRKVLKFLKLKTDFNFNFSENLNISKNRKKFETSQLKFNKITFIELKDALEKDKNELEELLKIKVSWKLNEKDWVSKK